MASRRYDAYETGGDEELSAFINSLADGRIICFAILVYMYLIFIV